MKKKKKKSTEEGPLIDQLEVLISHIQIFELLTNFLHNNDCSLAKEQIKFLADIAK